jgi:hypothetical protein
MRMTFFQRLKNIVKSNWSFLVLVLFPVVKLIWRAVIGKPAQGGASSRPPVPSGEAYKRGDVIDVEAKK